MGTEAALLTVSDLCAGYGDARVLHDVSFSVAPGETLVIIGRNGVGKTTLIESLIGQTTFHLGTIRFKDQTIEQWPSHRRNRLGLAWVPQAREVFTSLTVEENLVVVRRPGPWDLARVYGVFPRLKERRRNFANQLSGGEQQMLAIGRALMTNPTLLMLDEPVEGLAPLVVQELMSVIGGLRDTGEMSILLVEQKHEIALGHSDRCLVLDHGAIVHQSTSAALAADPALLERLVGVSE